MFGRLWRSLFTVKEELVLIGRQVIKGGPAHRRIRSLLLLHLVADATFTYLMFRALSSGHYPEYIGAGDDERCCEATSMHARLDWRAVPSRQRQCGRLSVESPTLQVFDKSMLLHVTRRYHSCMGRSKLRVGSNRDCVRDSYVYSTHVHAPLVRCLSNH